MKHQKIPPRKEEVRRPSNSTSNKRKGTPKSNLVVSVKKPKMSPKKIDISDKMKQKVEANVDNDDNNNKDNNIDFIYSEYESNEVDPNQDDDDSDIKEVSPPKHIKKPTATNQFLRHFQ